MIDFWTENVETLGYIRYLVITNTLGLGHCLVVIKKQCGGVMSGFICS